MVKPQPLTSDLSNRLHSLYAQEIRTTLGTYVLPRLLARSWPSLSGKIPSQCELSTLTLVLLLQQSFTIRKPSSLTQRCSVRLPSIAEDSLLLPPVGVWASLSPSVADHHLKPAMHRRLGEPLPHQLANTTQVHLVVMQVHLVSKCHATSTLMRY